MIDQTLQRSRRGASESSASGLEGGQTLGELLRVLKRHTKFISSCTLICFLLSVVYLLFQTPIYEAFSTVRIDPSRAGSLGVSDLTGGVGDTSALINTEIAVIESDGVIRRTLQSLPDGVFKEYAHQPKNLAALSQEPEALSPTDQALINTFQSHLLAKQMEGTQLIIVSFRDPNPRVAAAIVNQTIASYTIQTFVDRDKSVTQLRTWLSAQMAGLRSQVEASQKKLASFQQANNIIGTSGTNTTTGDRLRQLNDRLTAAEGDRIIKEAQLRAARTGDAGALTALFPNAELDTLQRDQAALNARSAQLSAKFGPQYPPLIQLKGQLEAVNKQVVSGVETIQRRLQQEFTSATTAEAMLRREYVKQTEAAYLFNRNEAEYEVLQADVNSSRELYDVLRRKLQQASVDAEVNGLNTFPLDGARVPTTPIAPKKIVILAGGLVLGMFAGIAAAFLREVSSDKLQNAGQLRSAAGSELIAAVPCADKDKRGLSGGKGSRGAALVLLYAAESSAAEAYRSLRNRMLLATTSTPPKTLLMTSAEREERTEQVSANYAVSLAEAGFRVLIVDTDVYSASLHHIFGIPNTLGFSDYLHGVRETDDYLLPLAAVPNLYVIPAGVEQLGMNISRSWEQLRVALDRWKSNFDYVLLQAAPILLASDGLLLANWADGVLIVTQYNVTGRAALIRLERTLREAHTQIAGVIIQDVPANVWQTAF